MISPGHFDFITYCWMGMALVIFPFALRIAAPYGRHTKSSWGPLIDNRLAWILMELPALCLVLGLYFIGPTRKTNPALLFMSLWAIHYFNRTLIFPFRIRTNGKKMPISIMLSAVFFNLVNGGLIGYYFGFFADYPTDWMYSWNFLLGMLLFVLGMGINWWSDHQLIHLRKPGETGYKIPKGGFFRWISCPNLFGEMIEWIGFALMTWCLPTLGFAIWTVANLLPRALDHHRWYQNKFTDYPKERKAVFPFLL